MAANFEDKDQTSQGIIIGERPSNFAVEVNGEIRLAHCLAFFPNPFTTPRIHSTLLRVFSSVPLHSKSRNASNLFIRQISPAKR